MTVNVTDVPTAWPIIAPEQCAAAFQTDGACPEAALAATEAVAKIQSDIVGLATALLTAASALAKAGIADATIAREALDIFECHFLAAAPLPTGARRQMLFTLRDDMIDLAAWLNCCADEGGVPLRARTSDPKSIADYVQLVVVREAGRLLAVVPPDARSPLRFISVFAGIEAASAALGRIGALAEPVVFAEIDAAASAVLAHKWPNVTNVGDVAAHDWSQYCGSVDIVCGGSPCQSFSVAGKRLGLEDPRGNLAIQYLKVVDAVRPRWFLYENVPGLLSSGGGADFEIFLQLCEQIGYSCAWRVFDAKYFGVPQRRRRVFVIGHIGGWEGPASVLFEPQGEGRDPLSDCKAWQKAARRSRVSTQVGLTTGSINNNMGAPLGLADLAATGSDLSMAGDQVAQCVTPRVNSEPNRSGEIITPPITTSSDDGRQNDPTIAYAADMRHGAISSDLTMTLQVGNKAQGYSLNTLPCLVESRDSSRIAGPYPSPDAGSAFQIGTKPNAAMQFMTNQELAAQQAEPSPPCPTAQGHQDRSQISYADTGRKEWTVRRFTPNETLRLQGFDDDWLDDVLLRGKPLSDSHKYKLIGNSWAVPCASFCFDRMLGWDARNRSEPSAEQILVAGKLLDAAGFEIYATCDDGVAGFAEGAAYGLLLVGYDDRGLLFRPIDADGNTDEAMYSRVPMTLKAATKQLQNSGRARLSA